jgi:hypothetical protein
VRGSCEPYERLEPLCCPAFVALTYSEAAVSRVLCFVQGVSLEPSLLLRRVYSFAVGNEVIMTDDIAAVRDE